MFEPRPPCLGRGHRSDRHGVIARHTTLGIIEIISQSGGLSRRAGLSRNTVRKYLRFKNSVEPKFAVPDRPSGCDPYADKLSHMLRQEAGKSREQTRTIRARRIEAFPIGAGADHLLIEHIQKGEGLPQGNRCGHRLRLQRNRREGEFTLDGLCASLWN